MQIKMPSNRGSSVRVIGAISDRVGLVHYKIIAGTNDSDTFADFTNGLVAKVKGSAVIMMDNYSVHKARRVADLYNDRVKQMFLPPYSCALNPIERLWNVIK